MLEILKHEELDVVVGSRYVAGGGVGQWAAHRVGISNFATRLSRIICKTDIADPMSGFFMMKRAAFDHAARNLSGQGFKILLDLLASSPERMRVKGYLMNSVNAALVRASLTRLWPGNSAFCSLTSS